MARHARIYSTIWSDQDFLALTESAQRWFLFLVSQPDITHAGILGLRERRWSRCAADSSVGGTEKALAELVERRFILIDEDTEEVLVRSFMRWDQVWRQPNIAKSAAENIRALTSAEIRVAVAAELERIEVDPANMKDWVFTEISTLRATLIAELRNGYPNGSSNPSMNPSVNPSSDPSPKDPGVGGTGSSNHRPPTPSPSPTPTNAAPAVADEPRQDALPGTEVERVPPTITQRARPITDTYAEAEPMCRWPAINGVVIHAIKSGKYADDEIEAALLRMAKDGKTVTVESLRVEIEGFTPRSSPARPRAGTAAQWAAAGQEFQNAIEGRVIP